MKWIDPPRDWAEVLREKRVWELLQSPTITAYLNQANAAYYHWSELKHRPLPEDLDLRTAWGIVKLSRLPQMRFLNLVSNRKQQFSYWLPDGVLKELHVIDQNAAGQILVDQPPRSADRERYILSSLMEEAIASSVLEGAATTRKKAKAMLREGRTPRSRAEQMIQNNYITMAQIKDRRGEKLSIRLLCDLQESITKETLDDASASGRLRNPNEPVQVVDLSDGTVLHVPPPANQLEERLQKMCDFANRSSDNEFIHPVVKASILHFWLAYEHPFVDGNGRTARTIFYWYLLRNNYWLAEFLPISRIILKAPAKYRMAFLYSERDDEDMTYFLRFNLRAFRLSIEDLKKYVSRKQGEMTEAARLLRRLPGLNHRQYELISHAIRHRGDRYTIQRHMRTHNVVYQTARTDLTQLAGRGLLVKGKIGRTYYFYAHEDLSKKLRLN